METNTDIPNELFADQLLEMYTELTLLSVRCISGCSVHALVDVDCLRVSVMDQMKRCVSLHVGVRQTVAVSPFPVKEGNHHPITHPDDLHPIGTSSTSIAC